MGVNPAQKEKDSITNIKSVWEKIASFCTAGNRVYKTFANNNKLSILNTIFKLLVGWQYLI